MPKQTIGEFLASRRKAKGMTQQEVADLLGISNKTLSSWESGRSYPDILMLPALAELYGVTADEILRGERLPHEKDSEQSDETAQKERLRNAEKNYSVKCAALSGVGIGGVGLLLLGILLAFTVAAWLFVLFAVLSALAELVVVILFAAFEKSALLAEEEKSRYSLLIKQMTYRAAFKIVVPLLLGVFAVLFMTGGGGAMSLVLILSFSVIVLLAFLFLLWLSSRGKEFYTDEEAASLKRRKKLSIKIFSVGMAIAVVFTVLSSILSQVGFTHTERQFTLPKEEFIRRIQTIELNAKDAKDYKIALENENADGLSDYFVDVKAALTKPVEMKYFYSEKLGDTYSIEGNLYLSFSVDYDANSLCSISYIPDPSEAFWATFYSGKILFREKEDFRKRHPEPTAEDLLDGIEKDEVFFVLDDSLSSVESSLGETVIGTETFVDVSGDDFTLAEKVTKTYPILAFLGLCGVVADAVGCVIVYRILCRSEEHVIPSVVEESPKQATKHS